MDPSEVQTTVDAVRRALADCLAVPAEVEVHASTEALEVSGSERAQVACAVPTRRADFVTGRWCAHRALERLGLDIPVIGVGPRGEPCWPPGAVGSITHASGLCAATAIRRGALAGIGIDLVDSERNTEWEEIGPVFSTDADRVAAGVVLSASQRMMILFAAKECAVKATSALLDRSIDFREIEVCLEPEGAFSAQVARFDRPVRGAWRTAGKLIVAAGCVAG